MLSSRLGSSLLSKNFRQRTTPLRALSDTHKIVYTETDEAPALATYSLLPIIKKFASKAGIEVEKSDISLGARIIAQFPKYLSDEQRIRDTLGELGELCKKPEANVIKLPNISASLPQLNEAITELRTKGYDIPLYVANPTTEKEKVIHSRYSKVLGSAVNPVIREGNSDRRVAPPVKNYAKKNPHTLGLWSRASKSHVAHMTRGDFYGSEQSYIVPTPTKVRIELTGKNGEVKILKEDLKVVEGEVIDASFLSVRELASFLEREIEDAHKEHMLFSVHLKATMMKVSDPIMFGHVVRVFFKPVFEKHAETFRTLGVNPNHGLADLYEKLKKLPETKREEILHDINKTYNIRPWLAMVDSNKGITNLHVPNDIIVDASMPCVVRDSGKMWNKDNELEDVKCVIPDRCYATAYQEIMSFVKQYGQFDVSTMGSVANVGLMAQKAEEYGSHDKTFQIPFDGTVRVLDDHGKIIFTHEVENGDIWRMCQTKDAAIKDWVKLAVNRARLSNTPAIFW
jgi:isocitrate dehydrogenase